MYVTKIPLETKRLMNMQQAETRTWPYWIIGILALGFAVYFVIRQQAPNYTEITIDTPPISRSELEAQDLPKYFPPNIPLESGPEDVIDNYTLTTVQGQVQSGRTFKSARSVAQNREQYVHYFANYGWTVTTNASNQDTAVLSAFKGSMVSSISIRPSEEAVSAVEIIVKVNK